MTEYLKKQLKEVLNCDEIESLQSGDFRICIDYSLETWEIKALGEYIAEAETQGYNAELKGTRNQMELLLLKAQD